MSTMNIMQPKEILNYKRFDSETSLSEIQIPETAQNRRRTDTFFLYIFIGLVVALMPFLIYTLCYSDITRINGYDNCGNVCGEKNVRYSEWDCTGEDMTDKPIYSDNTCKAVTFKNYFGNNIDLIDDYDPTDEEYTKNAYVYIGKVGWKIALASFLTLSYCVVMVVLFRHATAVLVWGILIVSWKCLLFFTLYLWSYVVKDGNSGGIAGAIILSITVLTLLCIMIFLHKKVRLVIMLIKESAKAVYDMHFIFFVPVMTILTLIIIATVAVVTTSYIYTSGILTEIYEGHLKYVPNTWMLVTLIFNISMACWAIQFIAGIQYMVISGAVAKWYFTKNKMLLGSPILTSALITFKYHLGTVALGSLIITLVAMLRAFLKSLASNPRLRLFVECCMNYIEAFLKFFTENSYIITAMHGTSFLKSGKQAVKLITLNICNTIVVNYIGDFVFAMAQVLVICLSILTTYVLFLGEDTEYVLFCYIIVVILAVICSGTILRTFQTAVDTMFLCFCEDCLINDGVTKPYAMSRGFMEFVESSKKVFAIQIQKKDLPTI